MFCSRRVFDQSQTAEMRRNQVFMDNNSRNTAAEQRHRREDDAPSPQPCRTQYDVEWEKTSIPVIREDKRKGKWRLRLRYSPRKSAKPKQVSSADFNTREEAEAAASWWRLSWERATSTSIFKRSACQYFHTQLRATKYSYSYRDFLVLPRDNATLQHFPGKIVLPPGV